jgi:transposase
MRLSFDGLYALTRNSLGQDPLSGHCSRSSIGGGTQIKCLYFDRAGLCIWSKHLEQGRLVSNWEMVSTRERDWTGLKLLLEGIEPGRVRRRYKRPAFIAETLAGRQPLPL